MKTLLSIVFGLVFAGIMVAYGVRDEMRLGELRGSVYMTESERPLPGATVMLRRRSEPGTYVQMRSIETDENGNFDFGRLPTGSYTIEAYAKAHSVDESVLSIREGDVTTMSLDAKPGAPYLRLFAAKHVFLPNAQPELTIEGFGQDPHLDITLFEVNVDKVIAGGGLQSILSTAWRWDDGIRTEDPAVFSALKSLDKPIERRDLEGAYVESLKLDALPSGMYWVSAKAGKSLSSGTYILVSDIALVTKKAGGKVHTFASHMETGKALSGVDVSIYQGATQRSKSKTDDNGFAVLSIPSGTGNQITVVAASGAERAIVPLYVYQNDNTSLRGTIVTDRPIYRPGHTVSYKGIVRAVEGSKYTIAAGGVVKIEVEDADAVVIKRATVQTDEFGGFSGSFDIDPEAATGSFTIDAEIQGMHFGESVEVAAYRKPDFEITVVPDKPHFVRGERITGHVAVDYYFGGPVPEAKVEGSVYRRPHYGEYEEYFSDYEGGGSGEYIGDFSGVTDGQGKAKFTYDTSSIRDPENDFVYTFEVSVSDETGRTFDGSGSVRVTRGEFEVTGFSRDYVVAQGEDATVEVQTSTIDGKPLDDINLKIIYGVETWSEQGSSMQELGRLNVTTNKGVATVTARASKPGYMVFEVEARDARGNVIVSRPGVFVPGEGDFSFGGESASLSVKMDKNQHKIGDVAQAVIISPNAAQGWVTVEGGDIYVSRMVDFVQGGNLVDLKIDERMLPNAYVTVQFVHGAKFYEGTAELSVDLTTREMNVKVEANKPEYEPGDTAEFRITATDAANGRPVVADLAFGLVDESIYAIRQDSVNLVDTFYPVRYSMVETSHSFPEIYLGDGDKDSAEFDVRRRFLDTAHWNPSVVTDENGEATVSVVLPDNLTTWRATARGLSVGSLAGQGIAKVVAAKPLMVRLGLPRFLTQGDEVEITATVNASKEQMDVTVALEATGVELIDSPRRAVKVSPQSPQTVRWRIRSADAGTAEFKVTAISGEPMVNDSIASAIPIYGLGRLVTGYAVGETATSKQLPVTANGYVEGSGSLEVRVSSSLAGTIGGSIDYLVGYPYGCVEQTLSRFIPTLIVSKSPLAKALSPEIRAQLPDMVTQGYTRLRSMQHSDGSWGWWETDEGDPYMTGLALEGYAMVAEAGRPPEPDSLSRAMEWARSWLKEAEKQRPESYADRLRLIRGVAANGDKATATAALKVVPPGQIDSAEDWASVALIAHYIGDKPLQQQAIAKLRSMAQVGTAHASWSSKWYGASGSAQATLAIATIAPNDPLAAKGIRYLLDSRRGEYWFSTADTAAAVLAITKVMQTKPDAGGTRIVRVTAGGRDLDSAPIGKAGSVTLRVPMDELKGAAPSLQSEGGIVYYTASWRFKANDASFSTGSSAAGLSVSRQYFRLRPRRLETGELRLLPSGNPVSGVDAGETVRAVVKIESDRNREFMMLEDPLPSGFEVLERSSDGVEQWEWFYWYSGLDIRDDRIVFFMNRLKKGESVIEYTLRAETPGKVSSLPAVLSNMYDPDDAASTAATKLEVRK
ncbi:MAG: MG2 domain-containing protein [Armatimonadota bacterium]|nr:MG2 domain-containing protein [Armatimonadota bacterium]